MPPVIALLARPCFSVTPLPTRQPSLRSSGPGSPERDAACGYEALGRLLLRVDALERLLVAAHSEARQGRLHPSASRARIASCEPAALPAILVALGFEQAGEVYRAHEAPSTSAGQAENAWPDDSHYHPQHQGSSRRRHL